MFQFWGFWVSVSIKIGVDLANEEMGLVWCSQAKLRVVVVPFPPFWPCGVVDSPEVAHRGKHGTTTAAPRVDDRTAASPRVRGTTAGETAKRRHP